MSLVARVSSPLAAKACLGTLVACSVVALALRYYRRRARRTWPNGVEVRLSKVQGAGEGLFAARVFEAGEVLGLMTYDRPIAYGEMTETYSKANAAMHDRCLSENIIIKTIRFDSGSEHCTKI